MDSINEIWMAVLNYMKPQVSETAYRMWLQDLILKEPGRQVCCGGM